MSAVSATLRGRRRAEAQMVDRCEIRGVPTVGDMDPVTGLRPETPGALIYGPAVAPHFGRCKVQTYEAQESTPQSGQHVYSVQRYAVHIPATVNVPVGHTVTVTASVLDPALVGASYRVAGYLHKTMATANRLAVDEVTA